MPDHHNRRERGVYIGGMSHGAVIRPDQSHASAHEWEAWHRWEGMGGIADTRDDAILAACHFLDPTDDLMLAGQYLPELGLAEFTAEQAERDAVRVELRRARTAA